MDDKYTTKAREEMVLNSALLKSTFLRLLSGIMAIQNVTRDLTTKLLRAQKDLIWEKAEHMKAIHNQLIERLVNTTNPSIWSTKRMKMFMAEEITLCRLYNEKKQLKDKLNKMYPWERRA